MSHLFFLNLSEFLCLRNGVDKRENCKNDSSVSSSQILKEGKGMM